MGPLLLPHHGEHNGRDDVIRQLKNLLSSICHLSRLESCILMQPNLSQTHIWPHNTEQQSASEIYMKHFEWVRELCSNAA